MHKYFVYILKCSDNSLYTGVTNNLERRFSEHNNGTIKGYTSTRLPVSIIFSQQFFLIKDAIALEKKLKGWSRNKKLAYAESRWNDLQKYSRSHGSTSSP